MGCPCRDGSATAQTAGEVAALARFDEVWPEEMPFPGMAPWLAGFGTRSQLRGRVRQLASARVPPDLESGGTSFGKGEDETGTDSQASLWRWLGCLFFGCGGEEGPSCGTCVCTDEEWNECGEVGGATCTCSMGAYPNCERTTTCRTGSRTPDRFASEAQG